MGNCWESQRDLICPTLHRTFPLQTPQWAGTAGCAGSALCHEFVSAVGLVGAGSACAAHELGPEGNSKVNPGGWKSLTWTLGLEERL